MEQTENGRPSINAAADEYWPLFVLFFVLEMTRIGPTMVRNGWMGIMGGRARGTLEGRQMGGEQVGRTTDSIGLAAPVR